jgi:hypothetical protein
MTRVKISLLYLVLSALLPAAAGAQTIEKKGTTPYVTHFVFRPIVSIDSEPFACISMPALAGPGGLFAMDIPHNTAWEIK